MAVAAEVRQPPQALYAPLRSYVDAFAGQVRQGVYDFRAVTGAGVTLTSWWRPTAYNAEKGGDANSQHLLALAVDLVPIGYDQPQLRHLLRIHLERQGLVAIDEGDHVHAQRSPRGVWDAVIRAAKARGLL